jgi:TIR domain
MIAISYRREDSLPIAGRLYDRLERRFGQKNVFMDFDSIRPGFDFRDQIKETIERSKVVIAVIGHDWLGQKTDGTRRIDDLTDFVRIEIAHALHRGIPVIPVLVNNTTMPMAESLPADIQDLAFRHALPLDGGLDFRQHAERLNTAIAAAISGRDPRRSTDRNRPVIVAAVAAALLVAAGLSFAITRGLTKGVMESRSGLPTTTAPPGGRAEVGASASETAAVSAPVTSIKSKRPSVENQSSIDRGTSSAISSPPAIVSRPPSKAPPALDIAGQGLTKVVVKKYNCTVLLPNALFPDAAEKFANSDIDHIQSVNDCARVTLRADSQSLKRVYEKVIAEFSSGPDPKAIDYKVLRDGWFVVSGDSKTAGYYTKGVRRRSDVLLLELEYDDAVCNIPDDMFTEMSRKFNGSAD